MRTRFRTSERGQVVHMAAVLLIGLGTLGLALLLGLLLPGAGFIAAVVVVVLGVAVIAWLVVAGAARQTPSELASEAEDVELLGPGGPDDPSRPG